MTVEAYYDGEAVRPIGAVSLQKNQRVFITVPDKADEDTNHNNRMKRQLAALEVLGGLLDDEEIKEFDKAMQLRP